MKMVSKKGEFTFSNYFVFMFLVLGLLGIFGGIAASMMVGYDVETTPGFESYIDSFNMNGYADESVLGVESSDAGNEFAEYEASFKFGEQVKETANQTDQFVQATGEVLGLPSIVWYIISGIIFILLLVLIIHFLRGITEK